MNKVMFLLSFITISFFGYCDTLDYYQVYLNDSTIGKFNSLSEKPSIELKLDKLKASDVITVRFKTDHSCVECVFFLSVLIEVKEKTPELKTTESLGKLSVPIKDLIYFQKKYGIVNYNFNYSVQSKNIKDENRIYSFELKFI